MRDRMERFVLLPFSMGCVSESSVAIGSNVHHNHQTTTTTKPNSQFIRKKLEEDEESLSSTESMKSSSMRSLPLSKPNLSNGFHRLLKGFKTFFVYEEEMEELEMEIGDPTDVKHVTHIGWDGLSSSTTTTTNTHNPLHGWENLISSPHDLISPSLTQFELNSMPNPQPPNHSSIVN